MCIRDRDTTDDEYLEPDGGWKWVDGSSLNDFSNGYVLPLDADNSGVVDFKEVDDFTIEIVTHPQDVQVPEKTTGYVFAKVNSTDSISYQWQKSSDSLSWTNVSNDTILIDRGEGVFDTLIYKGANADTLFIMNLDTLVDSTYYRVLVDIPTSPCADETPSNACLLYTSPSPRDS